MVYRIKNIYSMWALGVGSKIARDGGGGSSDMCPLNVLTVCTHIHMYVHYMVDKRRNYS
jgi:hypothetical protein